MNLLRPVSALGRVSCLLFLLMLVSTQPVAGLTLSNPLWSQVLRSSLTALVPPASPPVTANLDYFTGATKFSFDVVTRGEWGANPFMLTRRPLYNKLDKVIVHHTAWKNNPDNYAATVKEIYEFHIKSRNWGDIGYNYLIDPTGVIYEGHRGGASVIGVHTGENNAGAVGIAFMGDFENELPTQAALASYEKLTAEIAALHGFELEWQKTVFGHRDFSNVESVCPGDTLYAALPGITAQTQARRESDDLTAQRAAYSAAVAEVADTDQLLQVTFHQPALSSAQIKALLPIDSGIAQVISISGNTVVLRVESFNYYHGPVYHNTHAQLRWLVTYFKSIPAVESVVALPPQSQVSASDWQPGPDHILPSGTVSFLGSTYQFAYEAGAVDSALLIRSSSDNIFDGSSASERWQPHPYAGDIVAAPSVVVFQNQLIVTRVNGKGDIYLSQLTADSDWTTWQLTSGNTLTPVAMATFSTNSEQRLFQVIKPATREQLRIRSTTDGKFDDSHPTESWSNLPYKSSNAPHLVAFQNKLVLAFVTLHHRVHTVVSADGTFGTQPVQLSEVFVDPVSQVNQIVYQDQLYQSFIGIGLQSILTRKTSDAKIWTNWDFVERKSTGQVSYAQLGNDLYQFILRDQQTRFRQIRN